MSLTLAESMAMAVLKGDMAAAYALADSLVEELRDGKTMEARAVAQHNSNAAASFNVYRWPEFQAFATRLGFAWDLRTTDFTIHFPPDGVVTIEQNYQGADRNRRRPSAITPENDFREYE